MGVYLINFLVYSMAMVGLLFVCLLVYKKTMLNNKFAGKNNNLTVENALNLSQRKTLYVIKAGNEKFLIAADAERTSFLAKLNENEPTQNVQTVKNINEQTFRQEMSVQESKGVDYTEIMAAINEKKEKPPVMKEMLRKLSTPVMNENQ